MRPDIAVFGEKDYQQLTLIQLMATELCMKTEIIGAPTVREADGLAMSSRNRYLDTQQRRQATVLSRALAAGVAHGSEGADAVLSAARRVVDESTGFELDYLALTDPDLGDPTPGQAARLLIEGRIGTTRLLDNTGLTLGT